MTSRHFGELRPSLASGLSRRHLLAGLSGGLLALRSLVAGVGDVNARNSKRKKKRRAGKRRQGQQPSAPPPSSGPVTRTDATCVGPSDRGISFDGDGRMAQTFTALGSGQLARADLQIRKLEETFGDYILQLGAVDAFAVPTDEVLAATSVANFTVPDGESTVSFVFATPAAVVAGTRYALVLTRPGSNQLVWTGHGGDTCGGRAFLSVTQNEVFQPVDTELDLNFTTFVRA
jgi:hypothetical protein